MSLDTLFSKLRASLLLVMSCCFVGIGTERARGQYDPTAPEPIEKLRGSILLHGGGPLQRELREKFSELAGGKKARIVVIPTADPDDPLGDEHLDLWREWNPESLLRLHAASPDEALRADFCQPLGDATGVWFSGGRQSRLAQIYLDSPIEAALQAVLRRGGVVGGSSAGAAIATQVMLVRGEIRTGMDLLPGAIVDQHFVVRGRSDRLLAAVAAARQRVGFGIDEGTALLVQGRRIEAIGESSVTICLPGALNRPPSIRELKAGQTADYVALTRAARARGAGTLPLAQPPPPIVEHGTLGLLVAAECRRGCSNDL